MTDINVPPRGFKAGDKVYCLNYGHGKVSYINNNSSLPILVNYANGNNNFYTENGKLNSLFVNRCLFHADENVQVTVTAPVYEYQVIFKRKEFEKWDISNAHYKTAGEFKDNLNQYEYIELFLPSKRLV